MKRSRINEIMAEADEMIRRYGFVLPPFAFWTPDEFKAKQDRARARHRRPLRLGHHRLRRGATTTKWACSCSPCATDGWPICNAAAACAMPKSC